jgi:general secretion pathway protein E
MVSQPNGIILVTGPTGSGKTTTLYSTLKYLARPEVNVCTVEEPIEMVEPAFNQMQVQHNIGLDFASGTRTLMRQAPDIIMVGEIRDRETADMALQAALTGHLVLSTLHIIDAPSAVTRRLDIGVPHCFIKATLLGVVAQRLVHTLCPRCEGEVAMDEELWGVLTAPWQLTPPATSNQPVGCGECRQTGGCHGRAGLYEILTMTPGLRDLIGADFDETHLRASAYREGMRPLRVGGALKVAQCITSMDEVLKVAPVGAD